jgi:hypothetical protein
MIQLNSKGPPPMWWRARHMRQQCGVLLEQDGNPAFIRETFKLACGYYGNGR